MPVRYLARARTARPGGRVAFRYLAKAPPAAPPAIDPAVSRWAAAVQGNSGVAVGSSQINAAHTLVTALRAAHDIWNLLDDVWLGRAESTWAFQTSLKQRRLASMVNSPVFTAFQDVACDGVASYADTRIVPAVDCQRLTPTNARLAVWETTNVGSTGVTLGVIGANSTNAFRICPRQSTTGFAVLNAASVAATLGTSIGLTVFRREETLTVSCYKNGAFVSAADSTVQSPLPVPSNAFAIGKQGGGGSQRATHCSFACVGGSGTVTAADELAFYQALQTYMGFTMALAIAPAPALELEPMMLVLTAAQAAEVEGPSPTHESHVLEPIAVGAGDYVLPETILSDPMHADAAEYLAGCPVRPASDFPELAAAAE